MNHIKALVIKCISSLILLSIILGMIYDMSFGNILLITLVLGVISYILGDLMILPKSNNLVATFTDFVLAFFVIWIMGESLTYGDSLFGAALFSAAGLAVFEYFFHKYVTNRIEQNNEDKNKTTKMRYQTETSKELHPNDITNKDKDNL